MLLQLVARYMLDEPHPASFGAGGKLRKPAFTINRGRHKDRPIITKLTPLRHLERVRTQTPERTMVAQWCCAYGRHSRSRPSSLTKRPMTEVQHNRQPV